MTSNRNPWMKFWPRDWRGDQALRACSLGARGLWIEMISIMHEASPYGHLVLDGQPVSNDVLARMVGATPEEVERYIAELERWGVLARTRKGVIYSRRMQKDFSRAQKGRKAVEKRYSQASEKVEKSARPSRYPNRDPTTQKPEARSQIKKQTYPERFEAFWRDYPHPANPGSKAKAASAFGRLSDAERSAVDAGIGQLRRYCAANSWYHPPMAQTWLNQRRWETPITETGPPGQSDLTAMLAKHGRAALARST